MTMIFCPRCDRRLTPGHKCLSRRIFLASLVAPFVAAPNLKEKYFDMISVMSVYKSYGSGYLHLMIHNGKALLSEYVDQPFPFVSSVLPDPILETVKFSALVTPEELRQISDWGRQSPCSARTAIST